MEQLPFMRCQFQMDTGCFLPCGQKGAQVFPKRYYTIDNERQVHLIEEHKVTYIGLLPELFTIDEMLTSGDGVLRAYGMYYVEGRYEYSC